MGRWRTPRGLRPDERELWLRVADSARPLHERPGVPAKGEALKSKREPLSPALPPVPTPPVPLSPFRVGARAPAGSRTSIHVEPEVLAAPTGAMDSRKLGRLVRGKMKPEARLDLHGLTLAEAQPELSRFILGAYAAGRRLVLVITGKGRPSEDGAMMPRRTGALRREVPLWLGRPPLAQVVLEVAPAHLRHGGTGAVYVYLRRMGR